MSDQQTLGIEAPKLEAPHHLAVLAKRKAGDLDGWRWASMEVVGKGRDQVFVVEGGVPPLKKTGKNKGRPNWVGVRLEKVVVTPAEVDAEEARYEAEEGRCHKCGGTKQEVWRWTAAGGHEYRTCGRCGGTGKPPP